MVFTYLVGIETSLERHFQFDGRTIGLLLTLGLLLLYQLNGTLL